MKEARRYERVRTILGAQVIFNNKRSTLECQIRNISPAGARLVMSDTVALPDEFDVYIPQRGRTFRARLRWRSADGAGVEFLRDEAQGAAVPGNDLSARTHELERENELLRKRVLELMIELEKAGGGRVRATA
jgi:hypothetical protein